jgi:hypothetical protein
VLFYIAYLKETGLEASRHQLQGATLVCDCDVQSPCHGDALAAAVWEQTHPAKGTFSVSTRLRKTTRGKAKTWRNVALVALARNIYVASWPIQPTLRWKQEEVITAFKQIFPEERFQNFKVPMIEDHQKGFAGEPMSMVAWRRKYPPWQVSSNQTFLHRAEQR